MSLQAEYLQAAERAKRLSNDPSESGAARAILDSARAASDPGRRHRTPRWTPWKRSGCRGRCWRVRAPFAGTIIEDGGRGRGPRRARSQHVPPGRPVDPLGAACILTREGHGGHCRREPRLNSGPRPTPGRFSAGELLLKSATSWTKRRARSSAASRWRTRRQAQGGDVCRGRPGRRSAAGRPWPCPSRRSRTTTAVDRLRRRPERGDLSPARDRDRRAARRSWWRSVAASAAGETVVDLGQLPAEVRDAQGQSGGRAWAFLNA